MLILILYTIVEKEFATEPNVTHTSDSFVVVKSNDEEPDPNTELLDIIAQLKLELENEKATVNVLQLQKQGTISKKEKEPPPLPL